jgi:hypothetical protein
VSWGFGILPGSYSFSHSLTIVLKNVVLVLTLAWVQNAEFIRPSRYRWPGWLLPEVLKRLLSRSSALAAEVYGLLVGALA